ncbi:MAG: aconitase family protein [Acidimicrobiales bacterium]|nr:aconitase family protein [Acidimicrobiales bacterium]
MTENSFGARATLPTEGGSLEMFRLDAVGGDVDGLPFSPKVFLENLLRHEDGTSVTAADARALADWSGGGDVEQEISFMPARILMVTIFPIDDEALRYLRFTGREPAQVDLVERYAKEQGLWFDPHATPRFSETLELDLGTVVPSIAGPARPQDRVRLDEAKARFAIDLQSSLPDPSPGISRRAVDPVVSGQRPSHTATVGLRDRRARARAGRRRIGRCAAAGSGAGAAAGRARRDPRSRPRRHRCHHQLHQHLQPVGHARRRPPRQEGRRAGAVEPTMGHHAGENDTQPTLVRATIHLAVAHLHAWREDLAERRRGLRSP